MAVSPSSIAGWPPRISAAAPRRRLRREVRLAAWSFLALTSLVAGGALSWSSRASGAQDRTVPIAMHRTRNRDAMAHEAALRPGQPEAQPPAGTLGHLPVVVLSIESMAGAPAVDTEVSIVFPGYVLPDDSLEEPAHEGS
jgi:hypothetical protein